MTDSDDVELGAGAGYVGNIYSGEGAAGRAGFAYNTNTGAGVAVGGNNVYAGKDRTVYRYDRHNGNWSQNNGSGWETAAVQTAATAVRSIQWADANPELRRSMPRMAGGRRR